MGARNLGRVAILANAAGIVAAGYLVAVLGGRLVPFCAEGSGCAAIAADPRSSLLGVPLAYFALAAFGALYVASTLAFCGPDRVSEGALRAGVLLAACFVCGAAYFLYVMLAQIGALCAWCVAADVLLVANLVCFVVAVRRGVGGGVRPSAPAAAAWVGLPLLASVGALLLVRPEARRAAESLPKLETALIASLSRSDLAPNDSQSIGTSRGGRVLVVFSDAVCAACSYAIPRLHRLIEENPGTRLVYRHYPIPDHPAAFRAAVVAEIVAEQGKFWEYTERAYKGRFSAPSQFESLATEMGEEPKRLERRLSDPADPAARRVQRDLELSQRLGFYGAPMLIWMEAGKPHRAVDVQDAAALIAAATSGRGSRND